MREAPGASAATRERVLAIADELGYRPDSRARLLRRSRSRLLGVVFGVQQPSTATWSSGLYDAADRVGYELALSAVTPGRDEERAVGSLLQDRCEALVLLGPQAPAAYLADTRGPAARWWSSPAPCGDRAVDVVRTDDAAGLEQAVDHLVELGHRRIAHVDGGGRPARPSAAAATPRRCTGTASSRHALIVPGGLTEEDGAAAARALLELADDPRGRPPSPSSTTGAPPACWTSCAARAWRCPATSVWSASTTAAWRACRTSTSPRSPRTPRR